MYDAGLIVPLPADVLMQCCFWADHSAAVCIQQLVMTLQPPPLLGVPGLRVCMLEAAGRSCMQLGAACAECLFRGKDRWSQAIVILRSIHSPWIAQ